MIDRKVSIRYAKALIELCDEKKLNLDDVVKELLQLKGYFEANPEVLEYLSAYVVGLDKRFEVIDQLSDDDLLRNFMKYLIRKGRFKFIPQIIEIFSDLVDEKLNRVKAVVKSAVELTEEEKQQLSSSLTNKLNKDVEFTFEVDSSIMGGIIVKVKDVVYDGSIKTYLANLEQRLMKLSF
ncbi:ATP synthase F1 subunit delta [Hippea jasoniae]|uniref:ATP synthase F1 subunit delta n=1 Tax=Hippea jasoniae TaxID=944479 RepID=UPI00054F1B2E|nr:ATP synthase F1 subunit delta [Hippea jasoniae]